jgi:predicted O-methyltransferase YrrM
LISKGNTFAVPSDLGLLDRIRNVRRKLPELVSQKEPSTSRDFESISLPQQDADVLRDLLLAENARTVIEIGLAYGTSALAIGEALTSGGSIDAKHLIIDAYQHLFENVGRDAIALAGLDSLCTVDVERSQMALPRLVADGFAADAAFVDGSHIFHNVFVDLYYLRELVRPGGLIVLDDCQWPSVGTAVNYYLVNTGWTPELISQPTRLRAFRVPDPAVEPSFETFRSFQV